MQIWRGRISAGIINSEHIFTLLLRIAFVSYLTWVILYCQPSCPVPSLHLYYPLFPHLPPPLPPLLSEFLGLFSWVVSFNFMPPALALGPLVSARLAL